MAGYLAGATARELAAEYGIHPHTVVNHLHARGIPTVNRLSDAHIQTTITLYADGWSLARIGKHLGRHHTVIQGALIRAGIERRDTHGRMRS